MPGHLFHKANSIYFQEKIRNKNSCENQFSTVRAFLVVLLFLSVLEQRIWTNRQTRLRRCCKSSYRGYLSGKIPFLKHCYPYSVHVLKWTSRIFYLLASNFILGVRKVNDIQCSTFIKTSIHLFKMKWTFVLEMSLKIMNRFFQHRVIHKHT